MPQISFSVERELIKKINKLTEKWKKIGSAKSRSETIAILLRDSVPAALGERPLHEGLEPTIPELLKIIHDLEVRVKKLEEAQ